MTFDHNPTLSGLSVEVQPGMRLVVDNQPNRHYDPLMADYEHEINISKPRAPFDPEILEKLGAGIGSCPDVAFAYLCDVEVVDRSEGPGPVLFVWLLSGAVRSLKPALNLVSEVVAKALPEDRFVDVVILNSVPELLVPFEVTKHNSTKEASVLLSSRGARGC